MCARRNVVDAYRSLLLVAIVAGLDTRRHPFHVAVENLRDDLNLGTVGRNANAFLAEAVHVVGRRRWNRRGAMVTDRYQHVHHHPDAAALAAWDAAREPPIAGNDNLSGSAPRTRNALPAGSVRACGPEGTALGRRERGAGNEGGGTG